MYQDRYLTCRDCGNEFTFSASEQEFYAEKGFTNDPGRCPSCRAARKNERRNTGGGFRQRRQMYPVVCASCGKETRFLSSQRRQAYTARLIRQVQTY
jgi:CxxC-x17-CxxC domain-containing protein